MKHIGNNFPNSLINFIENQNWIFAKTYASTWPHEYIVQKKVDSKLFTQLGQFINEHGYEDFFYNTKQIYFDYNGKTYWHMEDIINRCDSNETFSIRKKEGRLPK